MQVNVTKRLSLSAEEVWRHLADFSGIARIHAFVESADLLSENNEGVGASRKCNFYDGNSVVEDVLEWESGRRMKIGLSEMSMPLKRAEAEFIVTPRGEDQTELSITMSFIPKFGPLGALMGVLMIKPSCEETMSYNHFHTSTLRDSQQKCPKLYSPKFLSDV